MGVLRVVLRGTKRVRQYHNSGMERSRIEPTLIREGYRWLEWEGYGFGLCGIKDEHEGEEKD